MARSKFGTPLVKPEDFSKCSSHAFEKAIYLFPRAPPKKIQEKSVIFLDWVMITWNPARDPWPIHVHIVMQHISISICACVETCASIYNLFVAWLTPGTTMQETWPKKCDFVRNCCFSCFHKCWVVFCFRAWFQKFMKNNFTWVSTHWELRGRFQKGYHLWWWYPEIFRVRTNFEYLISSQLFSDTRLTLVSTWTKMSVICKLW